ncbi:MAG: ubiquitin-like small modifier protein 1 [Miltoncostaeaceae bacterium]
MSNVKIPPVLRQAVGGERVVQADGATVGEVLDDLCTRHPAVGAQILSADGTLHKYVNLYVNDEDARLLQWTDTPVGDADTLMILPAMAGGAR